VLEPNSFKSFWGDDTPLSVATRERLDALNLATESRDFLAEAGLPGSAAPYLDFNLNSPTAFSPVHLVWTCLGAEYAHFRIIGNTAWGDPICIDESCPSRIIYLNHDDNFKLVFVNSSVPQLAHCLLIYREFVQKVRQAGGEDAFLKGRFPKEPWEWVCEQFQQVDDPALDEGAFWANELRIYN
jgi:hypothetical protein